MSFQSILDKIRNHPQYFSWAGQSIIELGRGVQDFVSVDFIGSDDALTVDNDGNVDGLSSSITLANSIKVTMNAHYADAGEGGEEHLTASAAITASDASDVTSLLTLTGAMLTSYAAHDDDAILASPVIHQAQGTEKALTSAVTPTTLLEALTRLNDLKAKLNDHMDDTTAHTAGDSAQEAEEDAAMGAAVSVEVTNAALLDKVTWGILDNGTNSVTGVSAVSGADEVTFTFSGDPGADTIISYLVLRQK